MPTSAAMPARRGRPRPARRVRGTRPTTPTGGQHKRGGQRKSGSDNNRPASAGDSAADAGLSTSERQLRLVAALDVSTAFLDAYVKDDGLARAWLAGDAPRWLGTAGALRRK